MKALLQENESDLSLESKLSQIHTYAENCRQRARKKSPEFFQLKNLVPLLRRHFWFDLAGNLFNSFYAPFYVIVTDLTFWFEEMGWERPLQWQKKLPLHWRTSFQKEVETFLEEEIFDINGNALEKFGNEVGVAMLDFNSRRNEKSDLNLSLTSLGLGILFFRNHDFSLTELTKNIAEYWANKQASSDFFLGEGFGNFFYFIFPQEPTFWHLSLTGLFVLSAFALVVSLVNGILLLLHIHFGLHQRRIFALIDRVEKRLLMNL